MLSRDDILFAWQQVKAKKSDGGVDKQSVDDFKQNLENNIDRIVRKLQQQNYLPEAYLQIEISKNKTEKRTLGLATVNDKIVQTAIKNNIEKKLETTFFNSSYAYREGRGARKAVNKVKYYIQNEKNEWLAKGLGGRGKIDVSRFKGLGEMDAKDLKDTTMNPDTRTLIRVTIEEDEPGETADLVERLMGKKPELRFQYISENAQFVEELDV